MPEPTLLLLHLHMECLRLCRTHARRILLLLHGEALLLQPAHAHTAAAASTTSLERWSVRRSLLQVRVQHLHLLPLALPVFRIEALVDANLAAGNLLRGRRSVLFYYP